MKKEDFFAKIERAEKQSGKSFTNIDELDQYIRAELNHFLDTFRTDELSEADIIAEVKAVRQKQL